jgi:plastocyanin
MSSKAKGKRLKDNVKEALIEIRLLRRYRFRFAPSVAPRNDKGWLLRRFAQEREAPRTTLKMSLRGGSNEQSEFDPTKQSLLNQGFFKTLFYLLPLTFYLLPSGSTAQVTRKIDVYLRSNVGIDTMWDGTKLRVFGMPWMLAADPDIPAPTIYCNEGDTVILNARSISQEDHHTIHLHGLDVDTRNDGDPATSFSLTHMQDTTYTFVAHHAGTYIYHCHEMDVVHVQMGMYGLIVVRAKDDPNNAWTGGPHFDRSFEWLTSEIDSAWHTNIPKPDHKADTIHVPLYKPSYFLINGKSEAQLSNQKLVNIVGMLGETLYVRIANIGFFNNRVIFPSWMKARKIDSDGRPLPDAIEGDTVDVAPGERYGVLLSASELRSDSVRIEYVNMNTGAVWNTQRVSISINTLAVRNARASGVALSVYPNPASNELFVRGALPGSFTIFDPLGRIVKQGNLNGGTVRIAGLAPGSYTLRTGALQARFMIAR